MNASPEQHGHRTAVSISKGCPGREIKEKRLVPPFSCKHAVFALMHEGTAMAECILQP